MRVAGSLRSRLGETLLRSARGLIVAAFLTGMTVGVFAASVSFTVVVGFSDGWVWPMFVSLGVALAGVVVLPVVMWLVARRNLAVWRRALELLAS